MVDVIHKVAKVNGGTIQPTFSINIRCDDWQGKCGRDSRLIAHTNNHHDPYTTGSITFYGKFFDDTDSLAEVVERGRNEYDWNKKYDMNYYSDAREVTLIHEFLHIYWITESREYGVYGTVIDYEVEFFNGKDYGRKVCRLVYGPRMAKILARWNDGSPHPLPGDVIARSDENLTMYMLAEYLRRQLGFYPHLPIVSTKPNKEPRDSPVIIDSDGNVLSNPDYNIDNDQFANVNHSDQDPLGTVSVEKIFDDSQYGKDFADQHHAAENPITALTNFHNELRDGWITVRKMSQNDITTQDVPVAYGSSTGVFDGFVIYWSDTCNGSVPCAWPSYYGDAYLKDDGFLYDSSNNKIGTNSIECVAQVHGRI